MGLIAGLLVAGAMTTLAQGPNFSGTWTFVPPPPSAANEKGPTFQQRWSGNPVTITQDAKTITIEFTSNGRAHQPVKLVYNLDGSERINVDKNSLYPEHSSRAAWRGSTLVLTTVVPARDPSGASKPVEITEELSLESPTVMVVHITRKSPTLTDSAVARYRR
jgi:hypothetical protein